MITLITWFDETNFLKKNDVSKAAASNINTFNTVHFSDMEVSEASLGVCNWAGQEEPSLADIKYLSNSEMRQWNAHPYVSTQLETSFLFRVRM